MGGMKFKFKRGVTEIVGVDIAASGIKAVRLKRGVDATTAPTLMAAAILPSVSMPVEGSAIPALILPKNLAARQVSISVTGKSALVKLLSFMGKTDAAIEAQLGEMMGIDKAAEFRISYRILTDGHGRTESKVLAIAIPEAEIQLALQLFPSGVPAPYSIELSGLASLSSFLQGPVFQFPEETVGVIDFGAEVSFMAIFNKMTAVLVRKFDFGSNSILTRVQESMGVDADTALEIVSGGSIDLSQVFTDAMDPFIKQLVISRDFLERRENCRISRIFVCGGATVSRDWNTVVHNALGLPITPWNPFEAATIAPDAIPDELKGRETRFAAAMGAAWGTLDSTL
jgi:Tfp pilus assembly PilM family ATPase